MPLKRSHYSPLSVDTKGRLFEKVDQKKWFVLVKGISTQKDHYTINALTFKGISVRT